MVARVEENSFRGAVMKEVERHSTRVANGYCKVQL